MRLDLLGCEFAASVHDILTGVCARCRMLVFSVRLTDRGEIVHNSQCLIFSGLVQCRSGIGFWPKYCYNWGFSVILAYTDKSLAQCFS